MQLSKQEILEKLKDILVTMDDKDKAAVLAANESTRLIEDLGFTSMSMLYMVIILEESFDIQFDDVSVDAFTTVGAVIDYIAERLK